MPSQIPRAELHQHGNDSAHQSRGPGSNTIVSSLPSSPPADSEAATDAGTRRQISFSSFSLQGGQALRPALLKTLPKIGKKKNLHGKISQAQTIPAPKFITINTVVFADHMLGIVLLLPGTLCQKRWPELQKIIAGMLRFKKKKKSMDPVVFSMLLML